MLSYHFNCHYLITLKVSSQLYLSIWTKTDSNMVVLISFQDLKAALKNHNKLLLSHKNLPKVWETI